MGTDQEGPVYHPEMLEDDASEREGLDRVDCFIDATRLCNASCMAYVTFPVGRSKELTHFQAHCALLLFGERIARHITVLAGTAAESAKREKTAEQDRQREGATPTAPSNPGPFASPFPINKGTP